MAMIVPDTIFDNPAFNDLPTTTVVGGRLMSSAPHNDGLLFAGPGALDKDSANLALTRNAKGDWSLNRTAAGAETYNVRISLNDMSVVRTGETYQLATFGASAPAAPDKGFRVKDFFAIYKSGVVALTSATLRLGKTVYSNSPTGAAFTQTDIVAAAAINTANNANYGYQLVAVPANTQAFSKDDLGLVEVELVIVMASTGTLAIAGIGAHVDFNYM